MKMKRKSILWGVLLIIVGVLFLGNSLDIWHINLFFKGWWTLFIIVPSIIGLLDKDSMSGSFISLVVGVLLLLACQDIISWSKIWKIFVPILVIVIGFTLIFRSLKKPKMKTSENALEYTAIFSEVDEKIKEVISDFKAISIFGGVNLDLRKAKLDKDIVIECTTIFGGIDIRVPDNVKIKTSGVPIFGGVENKYTEEDKSSVTIYINYVCVFGGIDIS